MIWGKSFFETSLVRSADARGDRDISHPALLGVVSNNNTYAPRMIILGLIYFRLVQRKSKNETSTGLKLGSSDRDILRRAAWANNWLSGVATAERPASKSQNPHSIERKRVL